MKLSGRMVIIQVTDREARLLEGAVKGDQVKVISALHLKNLSGYIEEGRIVNLSGLVDHLALAMRTAAFKTNRVMFCYGLELDVRLEFEEVKNQQEKKQFSFVKSRATPEAEISIENRRVLDRHSWGTQPDQAEQRAAVSYLEADRFFITALQDEFSSCGYTLIGVDAPELAILNLKRIMPYTYDSPDKLMIEVDRDRISLAILMRDIPTVIGKKYDRRKDDLQEQIEDICMREMEFHRLSNPSVFLMGTDLSLNQYGDVYDHLINIGVNAYDLREMLQGEELCDEENAFDEYGIGPAYGVCFAMLLKCFDKQPANLMPRKEAVKIVTPQRLKLWSQVTLITATLCAVVCGAMCISPAMHIALKASTSDHDKALQQKMQSLQAEKQLAEKNMLMIDKCNPFVADTIAVINDYAVQRLAQHDFAIASIDTAEMLPTETVSSESEAGDSTLLQQVMESGESSPEESVEVSGDDAALEDEIPQPSTQQTVKQNAVYVRGYATKPEMAFNFYNALTTQKVGDIRITGVEQVSLNTAEAVWVFEIQIKGGEYEQ